MSKLYILVGIPGCGKSTWAKQNKDIDVILSSDDYREQLLGNVNDQSHNSMIFNEIHKDMCEALNKGLNVCIDATNITRKSRASILKVIEDNNITCTTAIILFAVSEKICREQNQMRVRKVPNHVIDRMLRQFEMPFLGEGFNEITTIYRLDEDYNILNEIKKMNTFDQKNPNHTKTLGIHCRSCSSYIYSKYCNANYNTIHFPALNVVAIIHDIGKLYTQTWDEEKHLCHYIGHENYGAYKVLTAPVPNDEKYNYLSPLRNDIVFFINYHMEPFRLAKAKDSTKQKYIKQFGNLWDDIMILHEGDINAK